jgi:choline-sulfatase
VVKLMLHEEPVTVPLIVSWKGVTPSGRVDEEHLASGVDILPTICDYAGVRPLKGVTGGSLRPLIEDPDLPGRDFVVSELYPDPKCPEMQARMLRTRRYKYVAFSEGRNREMLFDLYADPGEMRNLALIPASQEELSNHRRLLRQWMAETDDRFAVPGGIRA